MIRVLTQRESPTANCAIGNRDEESRLLFLRESRKRLLQNGVHVVDPRGVQAQRDHGWSCTVGECNDCGEVEILSEYDAILRRGEGDNRVVRGGGRKRVRNTSYIVSDRREESYCAR